jgi:hypothetical protein
MVAAHNVPPAYAEARRRGPFHPPPGGTFAEVIRTKRTVQLADFSATQAYAARHQAAVDAVELGGVRTTVAAPLLKDDVVIGIILIFRQEVRLFSDRQVVLLTNFAAQAVIAIENARLLNELRESLAQQTATADVLKVISSSPGELTPVFETMLANATRLCEASYGNLWLCEGDEFRTGGVYGAPPGFIEQWRKGTVFRPGPNIPAVHALKSRRPYQVADLRESDAYRASDPLAVAGADIGGIRTLLLRTMSRSASSSSFARRCGRSATSTSSWSLISPRRL